jgi:hypothetical protein
VGFTSELRLFGLVATFCLLGTAAFGQEATDSASAAPLAIAPVPLPALPAAPGPFNENRILGVMPDYQTITDPLGTAPPLTHRQKWILALKETIDPFNLVDAAMGAAFSQDGNQTPKYGEGGEAYVERVGAAWADLASQNFFSAGIYANLLHEDPRYFRKGPGSPLPSRILYSVSRVVIARKDNGSSTFNFAGIFGMVTGIAASNLYYPADSINASVMLCRLDTSALGSLTGNLVSEFWPDLQKKFLHRHPKN